MVNLVTLLSKSAGNSNFTRVVSRVESCHVHHFQETMTLTESATNLRKIAVPTEDFKKREVRVSCCVTGHASAVLELRPPPAVRPVPNPACVVGVEFQNLVENWRVWQVMVLRAWRPLINLQFAEMAGEELETMKE